ncbi:MAG: hypothetical protein RBU37_12150, partial [Myxococcota bacterium]|nr:hypothetical protein [Myxococcota bacterium]
MQRPRNPMRFLTDSEDAGYLAQALIHYNHALDEMSSRRATETTKSLFDGLNNLQTAWSREHADFVCGEVRTFREMIVTGLDASESSELVRSSEFRAFALLEPPVMNHQTLKDGGYRPDQETPAGLRKKASEEHHKLANAYVCTQDDPTEENDQRAVRWATEVLYIVRSNIAHGEKTSFGPDTEKVARDEQVCGAVVPVQLLLFQLLLDRPETKLISYGTLAPGQPNHEVLSGLSGEWASCITRGNKGVVDGFPAFWWDPHGPEVEVQVLTSPD